MYHGICSGNPQFYKNEPGADKYWITLENFHEQMNYLHKHNYNVVDIESLQDKKELKKPTVILTFDDGDLSNYKVAYPVLREFDFRAYFFITVGNIGKTGTMSWEQLKDLQNHNHIIGSHGMSHEILTTLDEDMLDYELKTSKDTLEKNLGEKINYLSIPRGIHNKEILKKARECEYKNVFTSVLGKTNIMKLDFTLRRIAIERNWDVKKLKSVLKGDVHLKDKTANFIKKSSRKILGIKTYEKIRNKLLK